MLCISLVACHSSDNYYRMLYSGKTKHQSTFYIDGDTIEFSLEFFILKRMKYKDTIYTVLMTNFDFRFFLEQNGFFVFKDDEDYVNRMYKNKDVLILDSLQYEQISHRLIDTDMCNDLKLNPYEYVSSRSRIKFGMSKDSLRCVMYELLKDRKLLNSCEEYICIFEDKEEVYKDEVYKEDDW